MLVKIKSDEMKMEYYPKKASQVFSKGDVVAFDGNGAITLAVAGSTNIVGAIMKDVKASDADYALNTKVPVEIYDLEDTGEIDCSTTPTASMIGTGRDLTSEKILNVGVAGTVNQFIITGLSTENKVFVKLNANAFTQ